jgi:hypothetical protein
VDEHIGLAAIGADEAEAFVGVEKFDGTCEHDDFLSIVHEIGPLLSKKQRTRIDFGTENRRERYERGNKVRQARSTDVQIARVGEKIKARRLSGGSQLLAL